MFVKHYSRLQTSDQLKWSSVAPSIFWSDQVTICRHMGCLPYFSLTRMQLLLPFNIVEANYLVLLPDLILSTTNLITNCAIALQKHYEDLAVLHSHIYKAHIKATIKFEEKHANTIRDYYTILTIGLCYIMYYAYNPLSNMFIHRFYMLLNLF